VWICIPHVLTKVWSPAYSRATDREEAKSWGALTFGSQHPEVAVNHLAIVPNVHFCVIKSSNPLADLDFGF
jgi:hypothetical protein